MAGTVKIAISLSAEHVREAQEAVARGEAASVSAYISTALDVFRDLKDEETLTDLLAELIEEDGIPSAQARAQAEEILGPDGEG